MSLPEVNNVEEYALSSSTNELHFFSFEICHLYSS